MKYIDSQNGLESWLYMQPWLLMYLLCSLNWVGSLQIVTCPKIVCSSCGWFSVLETPAPLQHTRFKWGIGKGKRQFLGVKLNWNSGTLPNNLLQFLVIFTSSNLEERIKMVISETWTVRSVDLWQTLDHRLVNDVTEKMKCLHWVPTLKVMMTMVYSFESWLPYRPVIAVFSFCHHDFSYNQSILHQLLRLRIVML